MTFTRAINLLGFRDDYCGPGSKHLCAAPLQQEPRPLQPGAAGYAPLGQQLLCRPAGGIQPFLLHAFCRRGLWCRRLLRHRFLCGTSVHCIILTLHITKI